MPGFSFTEDLYEERVSSHTIIYYMEKGENHEASHKDILLCNTLSPFFSSLYMPDVRINYTVSL